MLRYALPFLFLALLTNAASAGTGYEVTSKDGEKTATYMVNFGGGMLSHQYTAYDPASKKFVYLSWPRGKERPKPVCSIWNHQTGETIKLYNFPGVKNPLPVIPSIGEMKACPRTGDQNFTHKAVIAYD